MPDKSKEPSAAPSKPNPSRAEVRKDAVKQLREHLDGKAKPEAEKPAEGKPAAPAPAAKDPQARDAGGKYAGESGKPPAAPAQAAPKQPAAAPRPADGELEGRLARTVRELNNSTARERDHKTKLDATTAERDQLKQKIEAGKANPLDLLEELGWNYEKLTQGIVDRTVKPRAQRTELPPEVKRQLDELQADKEQRTQREQSEAAQRQRTTDVANVKKYIEQQAEQYPFAASLEWAAEAVLDNTMAAKQADALPFLRKFEESLVTSAVTMMGNERALRALLKSKPELRESLVAALGVSTSKEDLPAVSKAAGDGGADGPRSVSTLPSGGTPAPTKQSKADRKRSAVKAWDQEKRRSADA